MSIEDGNRRDALKILGAIGGTCAFPFSSNELYGQQTPVTPPQQVHQHAGPPERPPSSRGPVKPGYFSEADFDAISHLAELIIPKTDTPGAIEAGVPAYIDSVVGANRELQGICRAGLKALEERSQQVGGRAFAALTVEQQTSIVTPWSKSADAQKLEGAGKSFFQLMKNLTADGYYTSYTGLVEELKYSGNTALDHFPQSSIREH